MDAGDYGARLRGLSASDTPSASVLEIALGAVASLCGFVLLAGILVGVGEFVQTAFRERRAYVVWLTRNWLPLVVLGAAAIIVGKLLLDPAAFFSRGPTRPALERWQMWVIATGLGAMGGRALLHDWLGARHRGGIQHPADWAKELE